MADFAGDCFLFHIPVDVGENWHHYCVTYVFHYFMLDNTEAVGSFFIIGFCFILLKNIFQLRKIHH